MYVEIQKTQNSQNNFEEQSPKTGTPQLQDLLQSHSNQYSMQLAREQKNISKEQNRGPRKGTTQIKSNYL